VDILSPLAEARNAYSYSADGEKLRVVKKYNSNFNTSPIIGSAVNASALDVMKTTDYVGNIPDAADVSTSTITEQFLDFANATPNTPTTPTGR